MLMAPMRANIRIANGQVEVYAWAPEDPSIKLELFRGSPEELVYAENVANDYDKRRLKP